MITITSVMRRAVGVAWLVILVCVLTVGKDYAHGFYDQISPVLVMTGKIVARTADTVDIHITGEKRRACAYMGIQAYGGGGGLTDPAQVLELERIDATSSGATRPPGYYDIGVWRMNAKGSKTIRVVTQHSCDGRIVLSTIASVTL